MAIAPACAAALIPLLESYFLVCDCLACDCCAGVVVKLHLTMQDIVKLEDRVVFYFPGLGMEEVCLERAKRTGNLTPPCARWCASATG